MAVSVQRKSNCGMSQVLGNSLDRIADPDGVCGVGVTKIMEPGFRNPDLRDDLLQMLQHRVVDQVLAFFIDENQVVFILPLVPGGKLQFSLLLFLIFPRTFITSGAGWMVRLLSFFGGTNL